jgi:5-methylcytosine-specific restriction endonuclease McrA
MAVSVGDFYEGVLLETCRDEDKGISRPRVRPVNGLPQTMRVEFPRDLREKYPLGTRFRADVKVCQKHWQKGVHSPKGDPYLRADTNTIRVVRDYTPTHVFFAVQQADSESGRAYEYVAQGEQPEERFNSFEELRKRVYNVDAKPVAAIRRETWQHERSLLLKSYAMFRSAGICEGCRESAPFVRRNGEPYLEVHHIVPVASGGQDHPLNVAAICPNCHARVTHGADADAYNQQIKRNIEAVETELPDRMK